MRPETKALYPKNWKQVSSWTIKARGNQCEECHYTKEDDGKVLTVHHIDYNPANNDLSNLIVLCQGCHFRRQARELADATRFKKIEKLIAMGQLCLSGLEPPKAKNYVQALRDRVLATAPGSGYHARPGIGQ